MLRKADAPVPQPLAEETVPVPGLGEVTVRALGLSGHLELSMLTGVRRMHLVLERCVLVEGADNGSKVPLYSAEEWEQWGRGANYLAALQLWDKASQLSDLDGSQAEKKSPAQTTDSPAVSP